MNCDKIMTAVKRCCRLLMVEFTRVPIGTFQLLLLPLKRAVQNPFME